MSNDSYTSGGKEEKKGFGLEFHLDPVQLHLALPKEFSAVVVEVERHSWPEDSGHGIGHPPQQSDLRFGRTFLLLAVVRAIRSVGALGSVGIASMPVPSMVVVMMTMMGKILTERRLLFFATTTAIATITAAGAAVRAVAAAVVLLHPALKTARIEIALPSASTSR
jgi:hypothetical protein